MDHESAKSKATLAGKVSTVTAPFPSALPFRRQFPGKTFKFRFARSARARAILVASQCIGIHFKGVQPGGDQIGPEGSSGGREIVINDGSGETSRDGSGKREFKGEMAAGAE